MREIWGILWGRKEERHLSALVLGFLKNLSSGPSSNALNSRPIHYERWGFDAQTVGLKPDEGPSLRFF